MDKQVACPAMLSRDQMRQHAEEWFAAWNNRNLAAILDGFAPDAIFRSPKAVRLVGASVVKGHDELCAYWQRALCEIGHLEFKMIALVCDVEAQRMVVHYEATLDGSAQRAVEIFQFSGGRKVSGEALYGT